MALNKKKSIVTHQLPGSFLKFSNPEKCLVLILRIFYRNSKRPRYLKNLDFGAIIKYVLGNIFLKPHSLPLSFRCSIDWEQHRNNLIKRKLTYSNSGFGLFWRGLPKFSSSTSTCSGIKLLLRAAQV
jgi:hypothetical protein